MSERPSTQERILREQRERQRRAQAAAGAHVPAGGARQAQHGQPASGYGTDPRVRTGRERIDATVAAPAVQAGRQQSAGHPASRSPQYGSGSTGQPNRAAHRGYTPPAQAVRQSPGPAPAVLQQGARGAQGYAYPVAGAPAGAAAAAPVGAQAGGAGEQARKKKRGPWNVIFYVSLAVFVACVIALAVIVAMYFAGRNANSAVEDTANAPAVSDYSGKALADLTVDWDALLAINPETVGWICIPGTMVNYPVVQTSDNETYLYKEFGGNYGALVKFGTVFVDCQNSANFTDRVNFLYGHNMNDGSMFAQVADLADSTAFNEHRTVYLLTPNGNFRLTSYALCHVDENDPVVQTKFGSDEAYRSYVQDKIDTSIVTPDPAIPSASEITKTFALSTCDNTITTSGRLILFCYVAESSSDYAGGVETNAQSDAQNALAETEMQNTADIVTQ